MFVVLLTYKVPLEQIDKAMPKHMAWLNKEYAAGTFVMSGRQIPRTGGVLLALGHDREKVEAAVNEDPFVSGGLASAEIIEFNASQVMKGLEPLKNQ